jgi:FAD-dependent oxidoreductase domain-containing protein 1
MDRGDPGRESVGELMTDILIIGGGVIGSAAAFFLTGSGTAGTVTVLEPDPLYSKAATPRASGGARRLFSRPENIEMSNYSIPFYENFAEHCTVDGEAPEIGFKRDGYLFIVPPEGVGIIERNHALQTSLGVKVDLLDPSALQRRFPAMNVEDIGAASHATEDGCLEPNGALQGFRKKARSQGADYVAERVVGMTAEAGAVRTVTLSNGAVLRPRQVICAAGTWSAEIAAMVGMVLPVEPMQRHDHFWECRAEMPRLPFVKDLNGLGFHNWDRGYAGSVVDFGIAAARTGRWTTTISSAWSGRISRIASPSWRS